MTHLDHNLRVEAVVLRHTDWGEADRFLSLFTREQGKIRAVAKGVRRLRSRKAGHLEPFTCVTLMLARGRDLWIVTQAETVDAYQPLREDLVRTGYAAYTIELLDRFTYEEGENRPLYKLLKETLNRIACEEDVFLAVRFFEIRLLDMLGFRPEFFQCVKCRSEIVAQDQYFSFSLGGVLCPSCGVGTFGSDTRPVSKEALRFLRHFQRSNYPEARRAQILPHVKNEIELLSQTFIMYHLERALKTLPFLRTVRHYQQPDC
jgi:DNA repair protein RecO (recombination protein O)